MKAVFVCDGDDDAVAGEQKRLDRSLRPGWRHYRVGQNMVVGAGCCGWCGAFSAFCASAFWKREEPLAKETIVGCGSEVVFYVRQIFVSRVAMVPTRVIKVHHDSGNYCVTK